LGAGEHADVADRLGAEGAHQDRRARFREAEELLQIAAGQPLAVEAFELLDRLGDGEQPARVSRQPTLSPLDVVRRGT
jgi:hypothetical protein